MNRFEKLALASVIVVSLLCVRGPGDLAYDHYRAQVPEGMLPVGLAGWAIFTYGPIALAVAFWRLAKSIRSSWALHLLLLPSMIALARTGSELMLLVIDDPDFDATMDAPLMAGVLLFLIAVGGYFGALLRPLFARPRDPMDVG